MISQVRRCLGIVEVNDKVESVSELCYAVVMFTVELSRCASSHVTSRRSRVTGLCKCGSGYHHHDVKSKVKLRMALIFLQLCPYCEALCSHVPL